MSKQSINIGIVANDGTGDTIRAAFDKANLNFTELYNEALPSTVTITDASTMDIATALNTLTTSSATRTFTISYTGDDFTLELTLNTTATTLTFPATSLCVSEGIASGDNTCSLAGVSGDKYLLVGKKIGSNYYIASKNWGQ